jgi:hypothetical protein
LNFFKKLCEPGEEVAEATVPPSEAHREGVLDSNHEEESDTEYSDEEIYLSEDDLELDDAVATVSQAPKPNSFEVMMCKAYKENNVFDKASFRYQRGPELNNKKKKRKAEQAGSCKWYVREH